MELGERVKFLRKNRGMNQKQLAEASKITQATISRIESGLVKELKSEALKRLAGALRTTVDYLTGKTDSLTPDEIIQSDPRAEYIFRGYENLSSEGQKRVEDFVRFLEEQEKKEEKK